MNVRNCRSCGKLFNYIGGQPVCPACKEALEEKFQQAKKYIDEHHGAGVQEVARECEVEEAQVRQWVREERLVFDTSAGIGIACEQCGTVIASGRLCDKCKITFMNDLSAAGRRPQMQQAQQRTTTNNPRMRFLDNKR